MLGFSINSRPRATLIVRFSCTAAAVWLLLAADCSAEYPAVSLADQIQPLVNAHQGTVGVAINHLDSGESFEHQSDLPLPTASLIKLPLMIATYQAIESGQLDLQRMVTLSEEDKVPGSGILTPHFSAGAHISLRDAIQLMMVYSDNTATNLVIDQVGLAATAEQMEQLDCPKTKLHSKVFRRDTSIFPERSKEFGLGSTTAAEMVRLLELLQSGELVSASASKSMLDHLYDCSDRKKLPRYLPAGTKVAHKTGSVSASRCAAGIIDSPSGPIVICVLTDDNEDRSWSDENAADLLCSKIALTAFQHFNPDPQSPPAGPPELQIGAGGKLVEYLQMTLNAQLKPSSNLGVDGDFGPATQAAVIRFQQSAGLEPSGSVGAETWAALGPLVQKALPIADPAEINSARINKRSADPLTGTPFVTCKAWAIGDAKSGRLLWGHQADKPLDMASTTKIMTAYLVTSLAEKDPSVLQEEVEFSQSADDTIGSTSGLRAGEKLPVGELLYGLLLPSGNDASVALGEHFGPRLSPTSDAGAFLQFVAAMNHTAQQLGMSHSIFKNTHGLTEEDHHASAGDLMVLAYHAMQQPIFRKIVGTVQHGCTVSGPGGYQRNIKWDTTNRLLKTDGYLGVKTGTTQAAGSCLVSLGEHDNQSLIVVVLGSSCTDARYTDSRNLYRWAWNQLSDETVSAGK